MSTKVELPVTCAAPSVSNARPIAPKRTVHSSRVTVVELILASSKRAIRAFLAAVHETRRMQAARFVDQHQHLIGATAAKQTEARAGANCSFTSERILHRPTAHDASVTTRKTDLAQTLRRSKASHVSQ